MSASVNYRVARLPRLILIVTPFSPSLSRYMQDPIARKA
jgi:hypothetical protein